MVKLYFKYSKPEVFGLVASPNCNVLFDRTGAHIVAGALENVALWNVKKEELRLFPGDSEVTRLEWNPHFIYVVAGHSDGSMRIWDAEEGTVTQTYSGHTSEITALRYCKDGSMLASGSKDTDIVVWDTLGESGLFRLRGHRGAITSIVFIEPANKTDAKKLISSSKDTLIKVWDLETQNCVQSVVGHRGEIYSIALSPDQTKLISGGADDTLRVYSVTDRAEEVLLFNDVLGRESSDRVSEVKFLANGSIFGCQNNDKTIEVFELGTDEQKKKRRKRRLRRQREKEKEKNMTELDIESNEYILSDEIRPLAVLRCSNRIKSFDFIAVKQPTAKIVVLLNNNQLQCFTLKGKTFSPYASLDRGGHRADVRAVSLSSDARMLVSCSTDCRIWNVDSKSCNRVLDSGYALTACFLPTNKFIAVGTKTGDICLYNVTTGQLIQREPAHAGPIWDLAVWPDGSGITSGSADHCIKFFGFDFGQTADAKYQFRLVHSRTLKMTDDVLSLNYTKNAHDDSVMQVKFVNRTHYFISAGKDGSIKYWDGDSFDQILTLNGHIGPVWGLAQSGTRNDFILSSGADRSMRIWRLTDEQVTVDEERERILDKEATEEEAKALERARNANGEGVAAAVTTESTTISDRLIDALLKDSSASQSDIVLKELIRARGSNLEAALIVLPFSITIKLLEYMRDWLKQEKEVELTCRSLLFLVRTQQKQLIGSVKLRGLLEELGFLSRNCLQGMKDLYGVNNAGIKFVLSEIRAHSTSLADMVDQAPDLSNALVVKPKVTPGTELEVSDNKRRKIEKK